MYNNQDYSCLNEFKIHFVTNEGRHTFCTTSIHQNVYTRINEIINDISTLHLLNINKENSKVEKIVHMFNNKTLYEDGKWFI